MAIGTALGAGGSTAFPIAAGEIAYRRGYFPLHLGADFSFLQVIRISMIHPPILAMYAAELALWCWLPGLPSRTPGG